MVGLLALSACLVGICGVFVGNKAFNLVASEPLNDYGITFDSSKNKLHEYTGSTSYAGSIYLYLGQVFRITEGGRLICYLVITQDAFSD